ncbi:hypothetical protein, partial [Mesorhizobium sp. Root157]|uniref:hypothetical protein n=1 Tax=Mesorhizobium sp. Root157 TaxID=1736477 RepID=UPI001AEC9838
MSGILAVTVRQPVNGPEWGSNSPPAAHLARQPVDPAHFEQKPVTALIHSLCTSPIIRAIASAGNSVRTGYRGEASVPDWSHDGVRLGD